MIKVSKTKAEDRFLYINLHGFRDEAEWDLMYKKIQDIIYEHQRKTRVFQ